MKFFVPLFVVLALLAGPNPLFSAEKPNKAPPAVAKGSDKLGNPVLKEVHFHGERLGEATKLLRELVPGFQAVVVPDPQSSDPDPALPDMDLKNVTLEQFLELLKRTLPQVDVEPVPG